jgi:hypothetical protein
MKADNEFLMAIAEKLQEIADNTSYLETKNKLNEFIDVIYQSIQ